MNKTKAVLNATIAAGLICAGVGIGTEIGLAKNYEFSRNKALSNIALRSDYAYLSDQQVGAIRAQISENYRISENALQNRLGIVSVAGIALLLSGLLIKGKTFPTLD